MCATHGNVTEQDKEKWIRGLLGSGNLSLSLPWVMETCAHFHVAGTVRVGSFVAVVASTLISLRLWQFVTGGWPTRPGGGSGS